MEGNCTIYETRGSDYLKCTFSFFFQDGKLVYHSFYNVEKTRLGYGKQTPKLESHK